MMSQDIIEKYKIQKIYSYSEVREGNKIYFGWIDGGTLNEEWIILSAPSSSKASDSDKEWSSKEGVTASNLSDYIKWFEATCSTKVEDFYTIWSKNKSGLELFQKNKNPSYREGEGELLIRLADLILNKKKFTQFGRTYKLVNISE